MVFLLLRNMPIALFISSKVWRHPKKSERTDSDREKQMKGYKK